MNEYSHESTLKYHDVVSKVKSRKVDNPEEEIASEHEPPSPHRLHTRTTQDNDVFLITDPPRDPSTKDSLVTSVTPDSPTAVPRNDTNAAPPTVNSKVTSGSNTNTSVAASTSSNIMSGSVVFGLLIGLVCLFFVIAVLIIRKRRSDKQNNLPSKFIHSKTISLHNAKLEPPGAFGTLSSKKKRHLQQEPLISRTDCPEELLKLAQECIAVDPTDRPTAAEALYRLQRALKAFEVAEVAL
ncbi:uncharacterized protein CCR75_009556 [Bremia lactucae]|uniref:Protein kinase n=1 Tax=Bremia lactucae TaxID=4779 RepID=A0A976ICA0_BRELC|nr:hypothetical protein CCR75_009556 [Bremia lactucae]